MVGKPPRPAVTMVWSAREAQPFWLPWQRSRHAVAGTPVSAAHAAPCRVKVRTRSVTAALLRVVPGEEAMMVRVPHAAGQLRNAGSLPIRLLRGFFSRIGQFLLAADRLHARSGKHKRFSNDDQLDPPAGPGGGHKERAPRQVSGPAQRPSRSTRK